MAISKWESLASVPSIDEFFIAKGVKQQTLTVIELEKGLIRYNFDNNTWKTYPNIKRLPDDFFNFTYWHSAAFHDETKTIYFLNEEGCLAQLKLNNDPQNEWKITLNLINVGTGLQQIMIKNDFHVIGGYNSNKHIKYNSKSQTFDIIHIFDEFPGSFGEHRLISLRNNLFMFGGYDDDKEQYLDTIYQCNIEEMKWNKLDIKMSKPLVRFGCTAAINNKYVLIFGGIAPTANKSDDIYIFSFLSNTFRRSHIKCPTSGICEAITINDKTRDELAVFGFVRSEWKLSEISHHYFPPHYLLQLMHSYYLTEYVHLIYIGSGEQWRMSTLDIIAH